MQNTYIETVTIENVLVNRKKLSETQKKCSFLNPDFKLSETHPALGPAPEGHAWLEDILVHQSPTPLRFSTLGNISTLEDLAYALSEAMVQGVIEIQYDNDHYGPGGLRITPGEVEDLEIDFVGSRERNKNRILHHLATLFKIRDPEWDAIDKALSFLEKSGIKDPYRALAVEIHRYITNAIREYGHVPTAPNILILTGEALLTHTQQLLNHLGLSRAADSLEYVDCGLDTSGNLWLECYWDLAETTFNQALEEDLQQTDPDTRQEILSQLESNPIVKSLTRNVQFIQKGGNHD